MTKTSQKIVSSDDELLILVDGNDQETGYLTKDRCHDGAGVLHRAFSIFLFDDKGNLLLQKRSAEKRLWPGFWSNSCCSHPRRGESLEVATERRLIDELGINASLQFVYRFSYQAQFADVGSEHELCSVFLGRETQRVVPNETEIEAVRYISPDGLAAELANNASEFTPWLKLEWEALREHHADTLARFTHAVS